MSHVAAAQKILAGGMGPVLKHILDFVGTGDIRLTQCNHAFRRAVQMQMSQVLAKLTVAPLGADAEGDEISLPNLRAKFLEIKQSHENWVGPGFNFFARHIEESWVPLWAKVENLVHEICQEADEPSKNRRAERLFCQLSKLHEEHEAAVNWHAGAGGMAAVFMRRDEDPMPAVVEKLQRIVVEASLVRRFREAIGVTPVRPALNPADYAQSERSLAALHERQKESVAHSRGHRARFADLPHHRFFLENLISAEALALDAEMRGDETINALGGQVAAQVAAGVPLPAATAEEWRAWLSDPHNTPLFARVEHLYFSWGHIFPPGIERFRNLRTFSIMGDPSNYLTHLPQEMAQLTQLTELYLTGHRFQVVPELIAQFHHLEKLHLDRCQIAELPPFLAQLPRLSRLTATGNPITVLPDALYRHLEPALSLCSSRQDWLRVDREGLTQIPFRLYFKEHFTLRHLDPSNSWLECIAGLLLALPIFLVNFIMMEIVEPIVTFSRDLLGYSRMVDVEPEPAERI